MMSLIPYRIDELIDEAERELALRHEVYPRLIERKQLSRGLALRRLEMMAAIVATLKAARDAEQQR